MTLGERIKQCRKRSGMSQEKVAELVGVSRQAVTKWESGQAAPNTENLFRLAEIFNTTVDLLLQEETYNTPTAEQLYKLYKQERQQRSEQLGHKLKRNIAFALAIVGAYLVIYLIGRLIWCDLSESSFVGWLLLARPQGENSYLYGWLLSSGFFWAAMTVSAVPALFGRFRFSVTSLAAFVLGLLSGIVFGPYPQGEAYGHGDYGWAIWGAVFLAGIFAGVFFERFAVRKRAGKASH